MIIAAHQPNFVPWLGYFDKMRQADLFIYIDHVQFERQNYQNRARIKTMDGPRWLTVPVRQHSRSELIIEKEIDNDREGRLRWGRKTALSLQYNYRPAPYHGQYAPALQEIFDAEWAKLVDLNLKLLEFCREALGIKTPVVRSSTLGITGLKSEMVLNLCKAVGADGYLSGMGGSHDYLDRAAFESASVDISWQTFRHPRYEQFPGKEPFTEGLSVLDLLFNCGPRGGELLRGGGQGQPPSIDSVLLPCHLSGSSDVPSGGGK